MGLGIIMLGIPAFLTALVLLLLDTEVNLWLVSSKLNHLITLLIGVVLIVIGWITIQADREKKIKLYLEERKTDLERTHTMPIVDYRVQEIVTREFIEKELRPQSPEIARRLDKRLEEYEIEMDDVGFQNFTAPFHLLTLEHDDSFQPLRLFFTFDGDCFEEIKIRPRKRSGITGSWIPELLTDDDTFSLTDSKNGERRDHSIIGWKFEYEHLGVFCSFQNTFIRTEKGRKYEVMKQGKMIEYIIYDKVFKALYVKPDTEIEDYL